MKLEEFVNAAITKASKNSDAEIASLTTKVTALETDVADLTTKISVLETASATKTATETTDSAVEKTT